MSNKICNACIENGIEYCVYTDGEEPKGLICKYEVWKKLAEAKTEELDKNVRIESRPTNKFQKYQNMEGRKQYHVSRNSSFYIFICLYVNAEEVEHFSTSYIDYDDIIKELHKAGFTEGFYSSDVAQKEQNYQKAKQEYEQALFNVIRR